MLWRRYHSQTETSRETKGRQKAHEVVRVGEHPSGGFYRGAQSMRNKDTREAAPGPTEAPTAKPENQRAAGGSIMQWFLSRTVRQATAMRKHVQKILNHQRDILAPQAITAVQAAI